MKIFEDASELPNLSELLVPCRKNVLAQKRTFKANDQDTSLTKDLTWLLSVLLNFLYTVEIK